MSSEDFRYLVDALAPLVGIAMILGFVGWMIWFASHLDD